MQAYSGDLLDLIDWEITPDNNIKVTNETADYYRYFDATLQSEFLYDCVQDTIQNIIPEEVKYLKYYEEFKGCLNSHFEMPDKVVSLLVNFLEQNNGKLSKRARNKEFNALKQKEIEIIESFYNDIFICAVDSNKRS
ncbi:MAG: hypothetical protein U9O87_02435 [Verrucomicrobiota bacterium]|nr:hypothetical protein [Verrucomicrobiota bacterium]